jgi:hypothetical protein
MRLPNVAAVVVPVEKISGYLLSTEHRDGQHKAAFFLRFGFRAGAPEVMTAALLNHAAGYDVVKEEPSPFGRRYVIEGPLRSPDGRNPMIRTVWFIRTGEDVPRFVTAYPQKERGDD